VLYLMKHQSLLDGWANDVPMHWCGTSLLIDGFSLNGKSDLKLYASPDLLGNKFYWYLFKLDIAMAFSGIFVNIWYVCFLRFCYGLFLIAGLWLVHYEAY